MSRHTRINQRPAGEHDALLVQCWPYLQHQVRRRVTKLPPGTDHDDVDQQVAWFVLRRIDLFDAGHGASHKTYVMNLIKWGVGYAIRELRGQPSRTERRRQLAKARSWLEEQLGRTPTNDEVADWLDLKVEQVERLDEPDPRFLSLDAPVCDVDGSTTLHDMVAADTSDLDDDVDLVAQRQWLRREIVRLPEPQRAALTGVLTDRTLKAIAEERGLSRERIRQLREAGRIAIKRAAQGSKPLRVPRLELLPHVGDDGRPAGTEPAVTPAAVEVAEQAPKRSAPPTRYHSAEPPDLRELAHGEVPLVCIVKDCGSDAHTQGLCRRHYAAGRRWGWLRQVVAVVHQPTTRQEHHVETPAVTRPPVGQPITVCIVDGCTRSNKMRRGLCQAHYRQGKREGWLDLVALPKRWGAMKFPPTALPAKRKYSKVPPPFTHPPEGQRPVVCVIDGCEGDPRTRGLCDKHQWAARHWGWMNVVALPSTRDVVPPGRPKKASAPTTSIDEHVAKLEHQLQAAWVLKELGEHAPAVQIVADVGWSKELRDRVADLVEHLVVQHWPNLLIQLRSEAGL